MQVTVGAITVTAQATSSADRHDTQGSGDVYLATNGDIHLAISGDLQLATHGDFHLAMDSVPTRCRIAGTIGGACCGYTRPAAESTSIGRARIP